MTELFNELAIVGDAIDNEDRVVYLLASLPDSFNTLVTALEANEDVPKMEVVTEWLLHAERKQKEKTSVDLSDEKVMTTRFRGRGPRCYNCWKFGHIQRNCPDRTSAEQNGSGTAKREQGTKADSVGLITRHVLGVSKPAHHWIMDSGATCHIWNSKELFKVLHSLPKPQQVMLGHERQLEATGVGVVTLTLKLPGGKSKVATLSNVLYVPELAYNLLSVPRVTEVGKEVTFDELQGHIRDDRGELVAMASKTDASTTSIVNHCITLESMPLATKPRRTSGIRDLVT